MPNLRDITDQPLIRVWDGVAARTVEGERITLAVVELDPDALVPEHRHPNEQMGMVIRGTVHFRIGTERARSGRAARGASWPTSRTRCGSARREPRSSTSSRPSARTGTGCPILPPRPPRWP